MVKQEMVMEAGETLQVKEGVDQETIDAVREVSSYKYRGRQEYPCDTLGRYF